ncbi:hypothetical protein HGM15179_001673 [Zosterops borbonicus]|uniref:Uncharacterized protein n=1 Tax=Zosterops borbonicus TaxID=364589 RepID=A0A8K1GXR7_9PASS|nr:hypothetical protein HGM15179_001673 [Zosterops borbonicus]
MELPASQSAVKMVPFHSGYNYQWCHSTQAIVQWEKSRKKLILATEKLASHKLWLQGFRLDIGKKASQDTKEEKRFACLVQPCNSNRVIFFFLQLCMLSMMPQSGSIKQLANIVYTFCHPHGINPITTLCEAVQFSTGLFNPSFRSGDEDFFPPHPELNVAFLMHLEASLSMRLGAAHKRLQKKIIQPGAE